MAIKNQSIIIQFTAWDTANNAGKTGDSANFTLKLIQDGTAATPTNSPSEVDATNCPGVYKITLTNDEMNYSTVTLAGKSSSTGIVIIPVHIVTEQGNLATIAGYIDSVESTGVVLAATQSNYPPAKAGDAMTLTSAYDAAKTAAPTGAAMTLTSAYDAAKTAAQAGNAMALVDDAITASKYDESTAFPIKSADTGATIIARPGDKMDIVDAPSSTGVLAIVDAFLTRAFGSVSYTGTTRCVLTALQKLRNKVANSGGTQTVYKENDSTASYTSTITTDAAADPVVSMDPDS